MPNSDSAVLTTERPRMPRTNAERTADTRGKLLEAAVSCLHELGYAASTMQVIAQRAGISRGAILHHFPTKVDLVLGVVDHVVDLQNAFFTEELVKLPKGRARYLAITQLSWAAWSQPSGIAITEIMIAARSDDMLAARLPPVIEAFDAAQMSSMWALAKSAGITDRGFVEISAQLNRAAIRGLCIDLMAKPDRTDVLSALDLLVHYRRQSVDHLLGDGDGEHEPLSPAPNSAVQDLRRRLDSALEDNERLKRLVGELALKNETLREQLDGPDADVRR